MYLKEHLDPSRSSRCGFIFLVCPLGCGMRVRSSAMESHTRSYCSKLEFRLLPIEFTIKDFLKMKESNTEWVSPPFYTHPHGYKACLVVCPNGIGIGKGSHVSIFVGLLNTKHDDQLVWPLELDVAIELLNWRENKGHRERTLTVNSEYYRVTKNGIKMSPGEMQFIHHSFLSYNRSAKTEYLRNNSLRLRVNTATIHSRKTSVLPPPTWQDPSNVFRSVFKCTMTEFSKRKQSNNTFYSPPFYTHQHGYKMCLRVHANGNRDGKDTHTSVHVQILAGDNDDQLQWPFVGDIVLELVNCREDKGHHNMTLPIGVVSGLDKVADGIVGNSFGFVKFISHSSLPYNRSTNTEFLHNDSLHLRVKQVVVYSTHLQLKTPSWQNSRNLSHSVCEFTLNEFSKRKQSKGRFYGPFFHTHQHGYKMCLEVYANGDSSSKGTHISVFVRLLVGENDDQLQWPFVGDIDIMLLNWREDKGHFKKTLSITTSSGLVRVLEGVIGINCWGYSQFVPHLSLHYDPTINTEYLQEDSLRLRVEQIAVYSFPLPLKIPSWQNPRYVSQAVCEFTLNEFSKRKLFNNTFYGPSFYTCQNGYKMCLKVYANGDSDGKNTHISVYVQLMAGDNDDQLQWPFVGDIEFMLLNWREDKGHHKKTLSINASSGFVRVIQGDYGKTWGKSQFVLHSSLRYNHTTNTEYLQNNSLRLQVKQIVVYSIPLPLKTPSWQDPRNVYQSVCEFTLNNFLKRKQLNSIFYGPSFYTHYQGYKMCIKVYANGEGDGKDTHVSVYVQLMAGEYDDQLQWPFVGDIEFMLLNWLENNEHHKKTLSINASSGLVRALQGDYGKSWGFSEFILHSSLRYNRSTNTEYVQNDFLRLRVKQVAVYSTPLLLKIPSWQNPHSVYQSVCECTLNKFSKRKQLDSRFCSPPFYTHRRGYKMRLAIDANGYGNGENTHVSVFIQLMAGEYDHRLHWPFVGDIDIMLLNWRENKRFLKKTISIKATSRLVRVVEGEYGSCWGLHTFISHSALRYDRSTNTEYLQDDCLRFRVYKIEVKSCVIM